MKQIVWHKRTNDYHACIENHPEMWGCGKSVYAAVGNLIMAHAKEFSIQFKEAHNGE